MGKYKKKSKFWKVVNIIGIILLGIIVLIVGLSIYSRETAKNSQIKPLNYQVEQSSTIVLNYRYKYTNDDLLLAINDIDKKVESIVYSDIEYRKLGGYEVIYSSQEGNVQLTVLISEISSKVHMIAQYFISSQYQQKIYLRNNCNLTPYELISINSAERVVTGFKTIEDGGYFSSSVAGEFEVKLQWSSGGLIDSTLNLTIVRGVIKNGDSFYQGFINWLLKQRKWIRRDLNLDI